MRLLSSLKLEDDLRCDSQLEAYTPNELLTPTFQRSGYIPEFDIWRA
jgi:hypothetical protein